MSIGHKVLRSAFEDHLSAIVSGFGTDVDDPVRRTDDIQVMFHDDHGVATGQEGVESLQEFLHIVEMKTGRRFVEDEHYPFLARLLGVAVERQEIGELDSLALSAGKGGGTLTKLDVRKADIHEWLKLVGNLFRQFLALGAEEIDRFRNRHIQDVIDVLSLVSDFQDVRLETLSSAGFADHSDIGHELHRNPDETVSLALRATSAFLVEGEEGRCVAVDPGILLVGQKLADVVVHFQIGHGIGTAVLPYRILVDIFDPGDPVEITRQALEGARKLPRLIDLPVQRRVKDVSDKGGLSRSADAADSGHHSQRKTYVHPLQIVFHGTFDGD